MARRHRQERNTLRLDTHPDFRQLPQDRCTLVMLTGPTPGALLPITGEGIVLGRDDHLPAAIEDRGISGKHARVFCEGGVFWVEDLDSTNGTFVNGLYLDQRQRLSDGDRIQLGEDTLLRVSVQDAAEHEVQRRMYDAAVYDGLTGIYNRGHFDKILQSEFAFAVRHRTPLALLFIDLDHFSQVNNTHGHQAGDAVLKAVAQAIAHAVRAEDFVARYGGEEFVIVARSIRADQALVLAERVRQIIANVAVPYRGKKLSVTASVGVACRDDGTPYGDAQQLVAGADCAVYRAKTEGRDCCCAAHDVAPESWRPI